MNQIAKKIPNRQLPDEECGAFVISLDFELAWGTRGRPAAAKVGPYLDGVRDAIRHMLDLFEEFNVSATWATVGALLMAQPGAQRRHRMITSSRFNDIPAGDHISAPDWYAEDILDQIMGCRVPQEIGCHTLTHLYVNTEPEGRQELADELDLFLELFEELRLPRPRSFVFPKAYQAHFDLLAERDFYAFRGPEDRWYEHLPGTLPAAGFRLADSVAGFTPQVRRREHHSHNLWMIPASQFFSPFMGVGRFVPLQSRVRHAINGLNHAARHGGVYHLWTHPFNMGYRTAELLSGLKQILDHASQLRRVGKLNIVTMAEHSPARALRAA
ncbi:MAG: polysaccharide deacetylase family protein [Rhodopirellula sp.]|nr:polysaccharide deacetylase family protein [Rhodopirellula sp.]